MASSQLSLKRSLLLSAFAAVSLFSSDVLAQVTTQPTTAPTTAPATSRTSAAVVSSSSRVTLSTSARTTARTPEPPLPPLGQPTFVPITDLPSLTRPGSGPIPTYPPPAVPDTQHAPFMNHSTLPDGTVFIAVGAILAAFGLAVIIWRGVVACLLHRSVERASQAQHAATDKAASFPAPPGHVYSFVERDSSPVHGSAAALLTGRPQKKSHKTGIPSSTPSQTNLFFSPTAAPVGGVGASRDTRFLPSGFYASASPLPGHNGTNSISMSTLRPSSRGRIGDPSPPDSPLIGPRRNFSSSTVNLGAPPSVNGGRAPSAFLDDLLDDQQGGAPYPQGQQPPQPQHPSPPGHRGY
ncbi:vacuolar membrane protein [Podospora conica]|nr:vacuolar membrane protein [Schizothecium conicum]